MDLRDKHGIDELNLINIKFLGLKKQSWEFTRGARTRRDYLYDSGDLAVRDQYSYTYDSGNRQIVGLSRTLTWFATDGSVILTKDVSPDLNVKDLKNLNREIRQGQLDYVEFASSDLINYVDFVPEPYKTDFKKAHDSSDVLFSYFEKQVDHYISRATTEFEDILRLEVTPVIEELLQLNIRIPDADFPNGLDVRGAIMYQLTGERFIPGTRSE